MILQVLFLILLLVPSGLVAAYYLVWAVARVAGLQDTKRPAPPARHGSGLSSRPTINRIRCPRHSTRALASTIRDLYAVTVVADNCHDATAHVARQRGVDCIERSDTAGPGKGFALGWALDQLRAAPHDALLVLDADCTLDSQALHVLDAFLQERTGGVLQANHRVVDVDASPISYAGAGGCRSCNTICFLRPSHAAVWPCCWSARGCCCTVPRWNSTPGRRIPARKIRSTRCSWGGRDCPCVSRRTRGSECRGAETADQLRIQRSRWARGNWHSASLRRRGWSCGGMAATQRADVRPGSDAAGAQSSVGPAASGSHRAAGVMLPWLVPGTLSAYLWCASLLVLLGYAVYLALGNCLWG